MKYQHLSKLSHILRFYIRVLAPWDPAAPDTARRLGQAAAARGAERPRRAGTPEPPTSSDGEEPGTESRNPVEVNIAKNALVPNFRGPVLGSRCIEADFSTDFCEPIMHQSLAIIWNFPPVPTKFCEHLGEKISRPRAVPAA